LNASCFSFGFSGSRTATDDERALCDYLAQKLRAKNEWWKKKPRRSGRLNGWGGPKTAGGMKNSWLLLLRDYPFEMVRNRLHPMRAARPIP
jgi:hypothetical protein